MGVRVFFRMFVHLDPVQAANMGRANSNRVLELLLREIIFTEQIDVLPGDHRTVGNRRQKLLASLRVGGFRKLLRQIQIIPANDAVLDQAFATLGYLLFLFFGLDELPGAAYRHRTSKPMGVFDFIELAFDRLAKFDLIGYSAR